MERSSSASTLTSHHIRAGVFLLLLVGRLASPQSLAEVARQERERRAALRGRSTQRLTNVAGGRTPAQTEKPEEASVAKASAGPLPSTKSSAPVAASTTAAPSESAGVPASSPLAVSSTSSAQSQDLPVHSETPKAVSSTAAAKEKRPALLDAAASSAGTLAGRGDWFWRGTYSLDWFRTLEPESATAGQLSGRMRFEVGRRPGEGWRLLVDLRDRLHGDPHASHRLMLYDARLMYESRDDALRVSVGRMNLYDSAGAGPLLGGVVSYRASPSLTAGTYAGIEPETYLRVPDPSSQKYGVFTRYLGPQGRSLAASYNWIRFQGVNERQFLYATGLLPLPQPAVVFGSVEYELNPNVASKDRLSRFFLNARYDPSPLLDVTAYASSGRGLDYRRFLLEQTQNLRPNAAEIERYYYSQQIGARLHVKPSRQWTLFVAQALSEQKDHGIRNHTTELGGSLLDFGGSGISLYGSFSLNRGASAESDSYRISASRDFGSLSWTGTQSSVFTGFRLDAATGLPELLRASDRRATSNEFFWVLSPALAVSLEHELASGGGADENTFFVRIMGRF